MEHFAGAILFCMLAACVYIGTRIEAHFSRERIKDAEAMADHWHREADRAWKEYMRLLEVTRPDEGWKQGEKPYGEAW